MYTYMYIPGSGSRQLWGVDDGAGLVGDVLLILQASNALPLSGSLSACHRLLSLGGQLGRTPTCMHMYIHVFK